MLPLALLVLANAPPVGGLERFDTPHLPNGGKLDRIAGPGVRLSVPAGVRPNPDLGLARDGGACWVSRTVDGDFELVVRVRLRFDAAAGAGGVTGINLAADGRRFPIAVPAVAGGVDLAGADGTQAKADIEYERAGDKRSVKGHYGVWNGDEGQGGGTSSKSFDGNPGDAWLRVRKTAGKFEAHARLGGEDANWHKFRALASKLPNVVELRLFVTGNLDRPYSVEFDRLTVEPLPAEEK